jgi:hypothetical protein
MVTRKTNAIVAVLFIMAICAPMADNFFALDPGRPLKDKRVRAPLPALDLTGHAIVTFPDRFGRYFEDHLGFRNTVIRTNSHLRYRLATSRFGERIVLPPSDAFPQVVVGKDGWLFYTGRDTAGRSIDGSPIEDHLGFLQYDEATLHRMAYALERKRRFLETHDIRYLLVIVPDKQSIYSEYLPDAIRGAAPTNTVDQTIQYVLAHTGVDLVDLRHVLLERKRDGEILYYKTDAHWNALGAYYGYHAIVEHLARTLPSVGSPRSKHLLGDLTVEPGDEAQMIGLEDYLSDQDYALKVDGSSNAKRTNQDSGERADIIMSTNDERLPRAIVFRDSFSTALLPYLSQHFQNVEYRWTRFELSRARNAVLKQAPDIVIEIVVQRYLYKLAL